MKQKYAFQGSPKNKAKALGKSLSISTKQSVEICKFIKGMPVEKARTALENAAELKAPIKFTRFTNGAGHKPGMGSGKYPVKTSLEILKVLNSAEANAQNLGLGADLVVHHACAHQAARGFKYGRHSRRQEKSTHIEIIVKEVEGSRKKKAKPAKETKKEEKSESKKDSKPEAKKEDSPKKENKNMKKEAPKKEQQKDEKKESKPEAKNEKPSEKKSSSKESKKSESQEDNK